MLENSYMVIIPKRDEDIRDPYELIENIKKRDNIKVLSNSLDKDTGLKVKFSIDEIEYEINICPTEIDIPEMMQMQHFFSDLDFEELKAAKFGIGVEMAYIGDAQINYHNQLKLIDAMVEDKLAVIDGSSEKVLSGQWVALAAKSSVSPAPRYIYTVQAISGDEGKEVWLHTHGLGRCGLSELEILCSDKDMYETHYSIIETMANRMLEMDEPLEKGAPMFLAWLTETFPFMATIVDWKEALKSYPKGIIGGEKDRNDPYHSEGNACIMCFASPDDIENKVYTPINILDKYLKGNPMYMFSNRETERMKKLALERMNYMLDAFKNDDYTVLIKIGLIVDEEFADESSDRNQQREHIWFELVSVNGESISAKLTQEPYYVKSIKVDDVREYEVSDIVDWIIFTPERRITPDDVYQLNYK